MLSIAGWILPMPNRPWWAMPGWFAFSRDGIRIFKVIIHADYFMHYRIQRLKHVPNHHNWGD